MGRRNSRYMAAKACGRTQGKNGSDYEKKVYEVGMMSIGVTIYCHHYTPDGKHCVGSSISSDQANQCPGVMQYSLMGGKFTCECPRPLVGDVKKDHSKCTAATCPWVAEGKECPHYGK